MPIQRQDTQGTSGEPKICVLLAWGVAAISAKGGRMRFSTV